MSPENTEKLVHMGMEIKNRVMAVMEFNHQGSIGFMELFSLRHP